MFDDWIKLEKKKWMVDFDLNRRMGVMHLFFTLFGHFLNRTAIYAKMVSKQHFLVNMRVQNCTSDYVIVQLGCQFKLKMYCVWEQIISI